MTLCQGGAALARSNCSPSNVLCRHTLASREGAFAPSAPACRPAIACPLLPRYRGSAFFASAQLFSSLGDRPSVDAAASLVASRPRRFLPRTQRGRITNPTRKVHLAQLIHEISQPPNHPPSMNLYLTSATPYQYLYVVQSPSHPTQQVCRL